MENQENKITEEFENAEVESEKETETPLETEEIKEITAEKKTSFLKRFLNSFKKNWKKIVIIIGAVILISALIFGGIFLSNSIKANKIEEQLKGMMFEEATEHDDINTWSVSTIKIDKENTYTNTYYHYSGFESYTRYDDNDKRLTHHETEYDLKVTVTSSGKAILGRKDTGYEIIFEDDEIVGLKSVLSVDDTLYKVVEESSVKEKLRKSAVNVFCKLTKWKNGNFEKMVTTIYKDYDIYCDAVEGSDTKYLITIEGQYYPNKTHLKNYTEKGTFSVEVDLETQEGEIIKDQGITSAYETYLALSTTWW